MGMFDFIGDAISGVSDFLMGGVGKAITGLAGPILGYMGQEEANSANAAMMREQMAFNEREAQKNRNFQSAQRETQYQTAVTDMKKAGLNPMLAYTQGGAGTTSGAQAASASLPQMGNKMQAALAYSATSANINNVQAQTEVEKAKADLIRAQTQQTSASTGNIQTDTKRLEAVIDQVRENVNLQAQQGITEVAKRALMATQADLNKINTDLSKGKIGLVEAQIRLTKATAKLSELEIPRSENIAGSQTSWWMRNVSPYLNDSVKATSAFKTLTDTMNLKGD